MDVPTNRLSGMETISTTKARPQLSRIVSSARKGSPVALTKLNLPQAVLVSVEWYERALESLGGGVGVDGDTVAIDG